MASGLGVGSCECGAKFDSFYFLISLSLILVSVCLFFFLLFLQDSRQNSWHVHGRGPVKKLDDGLGRYTISMQLQHGPEMEGLDNK